MYIVREVLIAKPGHAGELAQLMKKEMGEWKDFKGRVLLDFVTNYNKIVVEYEIASLADFENMMTEQRRQQAEKMKEAKQSKPPKYTELYQFGKREIYRIV